MNDRKALQSRCGELVVLLGDLKELHEQLLGVIQQKLAAMRRADTDGINSCVAREKFLSERIRQREGLRQQLVQLIARALDVPSESAQEMSVAQVAEHLPEPRRGQLLTLSTATREILETLNEANRVAALVTSEMLKHFREVYSAIARTGGSVGTYSAGGERMQGRSVQVFEAVG